MFLKKNKGDLVVEFVVVLVFALIMIFFVTGYAAKIWGAFFPSDDKSTTRSMDTFYSLIESKAASPLDYEMTPYTLYIKKDYCMEFFDKPMVEDGTVQEYAPSGCYDKSNQFQQCICLYDGFPSYKESKKEKNVMNCVTLPAPVNIDPLYFDIKGRVCADDNQKQYRPYLVIKRVVDGKPYLYILNDNADNRKKDEEWTVPLCTDPLTTTVGSFCYGKSDGTVVTYNDDKELKKIYDYCASFSGKDYKSTSIKCIYLTDSKKWQADCAAGDISAECGAIDGMFYTCDDFNQLHGIKSYISMTNDYVFYRMCSDDVQYCDLGCKVNDWSVYISKDINSPDGTVLYSEIDGNALLQDCNIKYIDGFHGKYEKFMVSYDTTKQSCVDEINKIFYPDKSKMMACNSTSTDCINLINEKKKDCSIKYLNDGSYYWITYYDLSNSACTDALKTMYDVAYFCSAK